MLCSRFKKAAPDLCGQADPDALHALRPEDQGAKLFNRLKDHVRSLSVAENLSISDFDCRYLVVRSAWVETAEDLLIDCFRPIWNSEVKVAMGSESTVIKLKRAQISVRLGTRCIPAVGGRPPTRTPRIRELLSRSRQT